jgi:hypothetical protein
VREHGIADSFQDLLAEAAAGQQRRHLEQGVLGGPAALGIVVAERLVGLEQRHQGKAEGVLHAGPPECVELATDNAQSVADGLIAVPAEADVEQVEAERTALIRDVQVDHVGRALRRHQAQSGLGQVAVRVNQDQTVTVAARLAQLMLDQPQQEAGFAAAGLGHRQQVAAHQRSRQVYRHTVALVLGQSDAAAMGHGGRQRQPPAGGGFLQLQHGHVVGCLGQVPKPGQLPHVEQPRAAERRQVAQVGSFLSHPARHQLVACRQGKRPVGGRHPLQSRPEGIWWRERRRDDGQSQLG